jgi:hypothetical protein
VGTVPGVALARRGALLRSRGTLGVSGSELSRTHGPLRRCAKMPSRWSADVTEHSDALDLERDVFKSGDPKRIARSLKRSAKASRRRKVSAFRSAMSMLSFYINRAGKNLPPGRRRTLQKAKDELRAVFGRKPKPAERKPPRRHAAHH